jgi:acetyl esterase/lipase
MLLFLALNGCVQAQDVQRVRDVIYEKKGGVALTMDVFKPARPNGIGVIWVVSGGWFSDHNSISADLARPFNDKGQTVFEVVHGSQPKYTVLEIVPQVQRAVRFIRAHAREYGVDPNRIGISGGSAGGHLSLMIAAQGAAGKSDAADPVEKESSGVQAVAIFFPPTDFLNYGEAGHNVFQDMQTDKLNPFAPAIPITATTPKEERERLAREESPMTYVTAKMPPTLVIHGDADDLVPLQQSRRLTSRLEELKVPNRLVVRKGKGHGWPEMGKEDFPLLADWFQRYLGEPAK